MKSVKNAFGGIIGGIILVAVGVILLWYNEANNVKNIKTVAEGRAAAININSSDVNTKNNGKLVNISGDLNVLSENITDDIFNIKIKTTKLVRTVEVYQWDEDADDSGDTTTYKYNKVWSVELISSNLFNQRAGHENPTSKPYESEKFLAADVKIGSFAVSDKQKELLPTAKTLSTLPTDVILPINYKVDNKYITSTVDLTNPQIGDVRISFSYNDAKTVTILAGQSDNTFTDYKTKDGKSINMIREGKYTATEMLDYLETQNNTLKWILRAVGTVLVIFGLFMFFGPISAIASFIPILGNLVNSVLFVIAFLLGIGISLLTISIAWIVYRPVLGVGLLIASIAFFILLVKYVKGKKNKEAVNPTQPVAPIQNNVNVPTQPVAPIQNNVNVATNEPTMAQPENNVGVQNTTEPQNNENSNNNSILQ